MSWYVYLQLDTRWSRPMVIRLYKVMKIRPMWFVYAYSDENLLDVIYVIYGALRNCCEYISVLFQWLLDGPPNKYKHISLQFCWNFILGHTSYIGVLHFYFGMKKVQFSSLNSWVSLLFILKLLFGPK